ncbi:FecR family protein [Nitrospira lenta]|uniref:Putative FpvR n=1 Tax=Nitrospira lenta TaxID=1436998 RepID=A0A330L923_9BACT|nr:FecR family protein [Nitrospira lenta]SPP65591.1 putative FpvR [Nitrospira lenta]
MSQIVGEQAEPHDAASIAEQALEWFVRLQSGGATYADRRAWHAWVDADPMHRREFDRCCRLWGELDSTRPLLREELVRAAREWECAAQRPRTVSMWSYRPARLSAVCALLLAVVIAGGWWFTSGVATAEYRTAKGERRIVVLPDGSAVTLNTSTVIATAFSRSKRTVVLQEGEALFAVSHSGGGPFEVVAGNRVVRDIGTQFVVRRLEQRVMVTVVEGAVEVQQSEPAASEPLWQRLTAGEQIAYEPSGAISPVKTVSLAEATAWLEGKVMFEDRPLSEVIQEVGRYQRGEIRILDPRIGALRVSGVFGADDRAGLLNALERAAPIVVSHVNGEVVVLEEKRGISEKQ